MAQNKAYQKAYYQKHKEKLSDYGKEWRRNNKEKCREYARKQQGGEEFKNYQKKYKEENKEKIRSILKRWRKRNPDYFKEYSRRPEVRKKRLERWRRVRHIENPKKMKKKVLNCYGLDWKEYREIVKECYLCSFDLYAVDLHHKDRNKENNEKENLIGLCPNCHLGIHRGKIKDPFL